MSASHKSAARRNDEPGLVGRHLTILPGVGLVDLDGVEKGELVALAGKVGDQLELFAARMREGLLAASVAIGLDVMGELMAAEVTELAGPKGKHNPAGRTAYRHGDEDGTVVLGGRKLPVRRPRVRGVDGQEVHLASYDTFRPGRPARRAHGRGDAGRSVDSSVRHGCPVPPGSGAGLRARSTRPRPTGAGEMTPERSDCDPSPFAGCPDRPVRSGRAKCLGPVTDRRCVPALVTEDRDPWHARPFGQPRPGARARWPPG